MAHTLTFNYDDPMSGYTVCKGSKNGEKIHSPYTLQNGDVLYFTTIKISNTINGTSYDSEDLRNVTLEFADVDVNIVGGSGPQLAIDDSPFVLKYTESGGSTNKVSIDLTTLSGWDNVSSGTHEISVVAKATGYLDSEKSAAVSFTKASVSTGETWVLNSQIETETEFNANISFKDANGNSYSNIIGVRYTEPGEPPDGAYGISFDGSYVYNTSGSITGWHNEAYRTITFLEEPTGDLLTWLTANGTKQGGTTAHTLTWSDQYSYAEAITVNGNEITSPYTLQNGDVIKVPTLTKTTINGVSYSTFDESTLNISGEDITIARTGAEKTTSPVPYITINYTKNANSGGNIQ